MGRTTITRDRDSASIIAKDITKKHTATAMRTRIALLAEEVLPSDLAAKEGREKSHAEYARVVLVFVLLRCILYMMFLLSEKLPKRLVIFSHYI